MFNLKGFLILIAFAIWVYIIMNNGESFNSAKDALLSYGGNALLIIAVFYILIIFIEFFIGIDDSKK